MFLKAPQVRLEQAQVLFRHPRVDARSPETDYSAFLLLHNAPRFGDVILGTAKVVLVIRHGVGPARIAVAREPPLPFVLLTFVAKYTGDGVLVYFGYPEAPQDDAERALQSGLALIAAVTSLAPVSLQTRIGIATGLVVVGDLIGSGEAQEHGKSAKHRT